MAKLQALLYVAVFIVFVMLGGLLTWGNASLVELRLFVFPPYVGRLGHLVILAFVSGVGFCLLMVAGYWWTARSKVVALSRQLHMARYELSQLRTQEIRMSPE